MCTIVYKQNVDHDYTQKPYLSRFHHFFDLGLVFLILYKSISANHKHHKYKDRFSNELITTDLSCSSCADSIPFFFVSLCTTWFLGNFKHLHILLLRNHGFIVCFHWRWYGVPGHQSISLLEKSLGYCSITNLNTRATTYPSEYESIIVIRDNAISLGAFNQSSQVYAWL